MLKLTKRAVKVLELAAKSQHYERITGESILWSLLYEGKGIGVQVLQDAGITLALAQEQLHFAPVEEILSRPERNFWQSLFEWFSLKRGAEVSLSPDTRTCIEHAAIAARRLGHDHIGTEHLLLGLLECGSAPVMHLLRNYNIDAQKVEQSMPRQLTKQRE